ncbi:hypothetical protein AHAS_Ahas12G0007700 [Arachis hypogaea]
MDACRRPGWRRRCIDGHREGRRYRNGRGMTTVPVQEQWGSYNSEDITRGTGGAGNGNGSDNVTSRDAAEEEQNIGGGTGLGLEEGEVVMEELVAVTGSA